MKKAFTLIELLVVIAIIAILAAILFPVFAQAKVAAKKTQQLSNTKQTGTAIQIYLSDYDDNLPDVFGHGPDGTTLWDTYNGYPAGWDDPAYTQQDSTAWGNSIHPYMKNRQLLEVPGLPDVQVAGTFNYATPVSKPSKTALVMNGLLSTYSHTAIESPSKLVLLWNGYGAEHTIGAVNMNPALVCDAVGSAPCRYSPGAAPQAGASCAGGGNCDVVFSPETDARDSVWMFGEGQNMGRTDSSAKFYRLGGLTGAADKNSYDDPFRTYGRKGEYWLSTHRCTSGGGINYMSFFRPDSDFAYNFGFGVACK